MLWAVEKPRGAEGRERRRWPGLQAKRRAEAAGHTRHVKRPSQSPPSPRHSFRPPGAASGEQVVPPQPHTHTPLRQGKQIVTPEPWHSHRGKLLDCTASWQVGTRTPRLPLDLMSRHHRSASYTERGQRAGQKAPVPPQAPLFRVPYCRSKSFSGIKSHLFTFGSVGTTCQDFASNAFQYYVLLKMQLRRLC